jgi:DnaJ-class molecular chaperone
VAQLPASEIKALARIIEELDYYQLLHIPRSAQGGELKKAYHASSRTFHPDANRNLEPDLIEAVNAIAKRLSEAYSVLRDPRRRQAYDRHLDAGDGVRMQLAEARNAAGKHAQEKREGHTPQGRQFYKAAEADVAGSNWSSAARNLQTALTFEPDNELFKEKLAEVRANL